ncbi:MAG TPA: T9SS type A sorting domain-containing protein, partial [Puia sp.]|nr:T9SS type A sorting domain-containing protein [Puia sp.]
PVRDLLNIRLTNGSTGKLSLAVLNMKGERVRDLELDKQSPMIESAIDVGRLPAGLYILEIITGDGRRTARKFVRQ